MTIRVTRKTARLLRVLLNVHADREYAKKASPHAVYHMSSMKIMEEARIGSGTFYPLIARLERHHWVEGEWEVLPEGTNRPRRRYYHLTEAGVIAARGALREDEASTE